MPHGDSIETPADAVSTPPTDVQARVGERGLASVRDASVINFAWLLRLRWGAVLGQLTTILVVDRWMHIHLPLQPLLALVAVEAASNVACELWARRGSRIDEWMVSLLLVADVLLLTGLLYLTGGPFNPFSFLYLVHIALAAVVLSERVTWLLALLSLGCFGLLFLLPAQMPMDHNGPGAHGDHLRMHLEGMWVAFGVAASFIVYFVQRVRRALADREVELLEARDLHERNEKFASLATLAAGAAHELATPLSTIALVAKELQRSLESRGVDAGVLDDAKLIRDQVERCKRILAEMTGSYGESMGEPAAAFPLGNLLREAAATCKDPPRVVLDVAAVDDVRLSVPRDGLCRVLRNVLDNALQASTAAVQLDARRHGAAIELRVTDRGCGMTAEVQRRVGEPFFTTKAPGDGMGLGLFLTRAFLSRLGGAMTIVSQVGHGTTVTLTLPPAGEVDV